MNIQTNTSLALITLALGLCSCNNKVPEGMILIEGTTLKTVYPNTNTFNKVNVASFYIDKYLVTYEDYKAFTDSIHYITEAEIFGNSLTFNFETGNWIIQDSVNYNFPTLPGVPVKGDKHPVTQVSWNDAKYYCECQGKRLPTDYEWELAAKNGKGDYDKKYSWGNQVVEENIFKANYWQGSFPYKNTQEDGFKTTSPVGFFGASPIGLYDMGGNVWQWCSDDISPTPQEALSDSAKRKVLRGGSFLCDPNVCHGFLATGRSSNTPESASCHVGFRCVKSAK